MRRRSTRERALEERRRARSLDLYIALTRDAVLAYRRRQGRRIVEIGDVPLVVLVVGDRDAASRRPGEQRRLKLGPRRPLRQLGDGAACAGDDGRAPEANERPREAVIVRGQQREIERRQCAIEGTVAIAQRLQQRDGSGGRAIVARPPHRAGIGACCNGGCNGDRVTGTETTARQIFFLVATADILAYRILSFAHWHATDEPPSDRVGFAIVHAFGASLWAAGSRTLR